MSQNDEEAGSDPDRQQTKGKEMKANQPRRDSASPQDSSDEEFEEQPSELKKIIPLGSGQTHTQCYPYQNAHQQGH